MTALARYGLARIAVLRGNLAEATRLGQACLAEFEAIGHYKATEVAHWLQSFSE